jgi:hypothetical protein
MDTTGPALWARLRLHSQSINFQAANFFTYIEQGQTK